MTEPEGGWPTSQQRGRNSYGVQCIHDTGTFIIIVVSSGGGVKENPEREGERERKLGNEITNLGF
jgi:hypothetical protein